MPVKYFSPKVTVKLCIIDFPPRGYCGKKMKNLNVCSAHSYHGLLLGKKGVGRKPNSFYNIFTDGL
jgi:hypothetical protein